VHPVLIILSGVISAFSTDLWAAHPVCEANQISKFVIATGRNDSAGNDECEAPRGELPPEIEEAITSLGKSNQQVAELFDLTARDLLPEGLKFYLFAHALGTFASYSWEGDIHIGFVRPWSGTQPNPSVYTHELGHYLTFQKNESLPSVLRALNAGALFQETFADFIALAATDRVIGHEDDLPGCLSNARRIMRFQSYDYPMGYFDNYFSNRRVKACCESLKAKGKLNSRTKGICDDNFMKKTIPPMDRSRLVVSEAKELSRFGSVISKIDPHQYGIPLNSFFYALSRRTGRPMKDLLMPAIRVGLDKSIQLKCEMQKDGVTYFEGEKTVPSFAQMVRSAREQMRTESDRRIFDELWKSHAMDRGIPAYDNESLDIALRSFFQDFLNYLDPPEPVLQCKSTLTGASGDGASDTGFTDPSCRVVCRR